MIFSRIRFSQIALISVLMLASTSFAQEKSMKAYITLFPASDFVASTSDITGNAEMVSATEVKAQNVKINLSTLYFKIIKYCIY